MNHKRKAGITIAIIAFACVNFLVLYHYWNTFVSGFLFAQLCGLLDRVWKRCVSAE